MATRPELVGRAETEARADRLGLAWGLLGILGFSLSLPMTRLAVGEIDGTLVGLGRAVVAAGLAAIYLWRSRAPRPSPAELRGLAIVALGVVIGFPLLTAWALTAVPSIHGAVVTGLLPLGTAIMAVVRAGERPSRAYWALSAVGLLAVVLFGISVGGGSLHWADGLLLLAVLSAGLGYAEGGRLTRTLGAAPVISWALVLSAPFIAVPVVGVLLSKGWPVAGPAAWAGFAYVSLISMYLAFLAWYRGLALGGIARVGQIQILQPVFTVIWSVLLLGEPLDLATIIAGVAVIGVAAAGRRVR